MRCRCVHSRHVPHGVAGWIATGQPERDMSALAPSRFGPLAEEVLVERGVWQYAHYYDPMAAPPAR